MKDCCYYRDKLKRAVKRIKDQEESLDEYDRKIAAMEAKHKQDAVKLEVIEKIMSGEMSVSKGHVCNFSMEAETRDAIYGCRVERFVIGHDWEFSFHTNEAPDASTIIGDAYIVLSKSK